MTVLRCGNLSDARLQEREDETYRTSDTGDNRYFLPISTFPFSIRARTC